MLKLVTKDDDDNNDDSIIRSLILPVHCLEMFAAYVRSEESNKHWKTV